MRETRTFRVLWAAVEGPGGTKALQMERMRRVHRAMCESLAKTAFRGLQWTLGTEK